MADFPLVSCFEPKREQHCFLSMVEEEAASILAKIAINVDGDVIAFLLVLCVLIVTFCALSLDAL